MEAGIIIIGILLAFALGIRVGKKATHIEGNLVVDYSDPLDGPYLFLELTTPVTTIVNQERATFDVVVKSYISHE